MTKRKRKPIMSGFDFQKIDPYGGAITEGETATTFHIDTLIPDPNQPRNLLPADLYAQLFVDHQRPSAVLQEWLARAAAADAPRALRQDVEGLRRLASTIDHKGLINPITVREPLPLDGELPAGIEYVIVTGERRWWAHVLLTTERRPVGEGAQPDQIRATVVPAEGVRALQLIENIAREDLSLLEKAQGIVALREELEEESDGRVTWGEVEEMLGMSRSYRTRILKVLRLSPEAQRLVREHDLTEKVVRPVAENLLDRPELQEKVLAQAVRWQQSEDESGSHRQVAQLVERLLAAEQPPQPKRPAAERWVSSFRRQVNGTLRLFDDLETEELAEVTRQLGTEHHDLRHQLARLRRQLDQILAATGGEGE
jgi:ParB/RepB/Spo0J family partition protein